MVAYLKGDGRTGGNRDGGGTGGSTAVADDVGVASGVRGDEAEVSVGGGPSRGGGLGARVGVAGRVETVDGLATSGDLLDEAVGRDDRGAEEGGKEGLGVHLVGCLGSCGNGCLWVVKRTDEKLTEQRVNWFKEGRV